MGWLQKRNQINVVSSSFSIGLNKRILLVGLGNPGSEYLHTRHNIGFECLDYFASNFEEIGNWIQKKDLEALISTGNLSDKGLILAKPLTYMNKSGEAVKKISDYYKINYQDILIVHDELDIEFGQIKTKFGAGSAGHNGVKSVQEQLKTKDFNRIRIGIKNAQLTKTESKDFVLKKFDTTELSEIEKLKKEVNALIIEFIYSGSIINSETRSFLY